MNVRVTTDWAELVPVIANSANQISIAETLPTECRRLRPEIHEMLIAAAKSLPKGSCLHVVEAFRTQGRQFEKWNRRLVSLAREFPDQNLKNLLELCRIDIADPVNNPSGHQGGTAIDVTIIENGTALDMGGEVGSFSQHELIPTESSFITVLQRQNRMRLKTCMEAVGFLNYDKEWWHYSYADRLWAAMKYFGEDCQEVPRSMYKYGACYGGASDLSETFLEYVS